MLSALQPSRPKPPQQDQRPSYVQQQKRSLHEQTHAPPFPPPTSRISDTVNPPNPRSQIEAMPPFGPAQAPLLPPRNLYDSAVRHPVFFTESLRKPPFPIPEMASHGFSPVASGYIMEARKVDPHGIPRTKL